VQNGMSALPSKADTRASGWHVRFGPKADISWHYSNHQDASSSAILTRLFGLRFLLNAMSLRELARAIVRALILVCFLLPPALAQADEPTITIMVGNNKRSFTRGELLMRPDATTIEVARDVNMVPLHRRNATSPCVRKYSPLRTRLPSVRPPHRTHH